MDLSNTTILHFEQDLAYLESEEIDRIKAITKRERAEKEASEKKAAEEYDAALEKEKASKEAVRLKRLRALAGTPLNI